MLFPLISSKDLDRLTARLFRNLECTPVWAVLDQEGNTEHAELRWRDYRLSLNLVRAPYDGFGPAVQALQVADKETVDSYHTRCVGDGASIVQGPEQSPVAYSFTVADPDGNHWWIHAETGLLNELRSP